MAWVQSLPGELPYATGVAKKRGGGSPELLRQVGEGGSTVRRSVQAAGAMPLAVSPAALPTPGLSLEETRGL